MRLHLAAAVIAATLSGSLIDTAAHAEKPVAVGKATYDRLRSQLLQRPTVTKTVYRHILASARRSVYWADRPTLKIVYINKEPASSAIRIESAIVSGKSPNRSVAAEGAFHISRDGKLRQVHGWAGRPLFGE